MSENEPSDDEQSFREHVEEIREQCDEQDRGPTRKQRGTVTHEGEGGTTHTYGVITGLSDGFVRIDDDGEIVIIPRTRVIEIRFSDGPER